MALGTAVDPSTSKTGGGSLRLVEKERGAKKDHGRRRRRFPTTDWSCRT